MILPILIATLLAVGVVVWLAYPLVRTPGARSVAGPGASAELLARRDRVFDELREADFDFRVGKLTPEDYQATHERLESEAARILHAIDVQIAALDEDIERDVREYRTLRRACPHCDAPVAPGARFCVSCGAALQATVKR
ncbi:MAG TPA: zinc ribbon domain-containing protein [Chloroflexota bacterium]|nr:zinc ribbon domain-containing protein [Chloroflexota bacterium]